MQASENISNRVEEKPELSVVVPVFNETPKNLALLLERLNAVLKPLLIFYEVVFVDDGSKKETSNILHQLPNNFPFVRVVVLSRNFGEQAAIYAGLSHALGRVVINMDSDLQDPPDLLPTMLQFWRDGYDVVYTKQVNRTDPFGYLMLVNFYYWLLNKISPTTITHAGEFRLMSRRAVDALLSLTEKTIFLRYLVPWIGFEQTAIVFERQKRNHGRSAYTFWRLFKLAVVGLISASSFPLILCTLLGLGLVGICIILYFSPHLPNFLPRSGVGFLVGLGTAINTISLIALSCYASVVLNESRNRPRYIVAEVIENTFKAELSVKESILSSQEVV